MNILEFFHLVQSNARELRELEPVLVRFFNRLWRGWYSLCKVSAQLDSRQRWSQPVPGQTDVEERAQDLRRLQQDFRLFWRIHFVSLKSGTEVGV
jgi:hypothetical protein